MHTRILAALIGLTLGVLCGESSVHASEIAIGSFVLTLLQVSLFVFEKVKKGRIVGEEMSTAGSSHVFQSYPNRRVPLSLLSALVFLFITIGIVRVEFSEEKNIFTCEKSCTFSATIRSSPKIQNDYQVFFVTQEDSSHIYDVQVKAPLYPRYKVGENILLTGKVTRPRNSLPKSGEKFFDYGMYLRLHDVGSEMLYPKIEITSGGEKNGRFTDKLISFKEERISIISKYVNEPSASLSSGMLFGASFMSKDLVQTFRVAGLSHIVVLSGFNIAILISFVLLVLFFVPLFFRISLAALFVLLFVLAVGAEPSIVRATLMSLVSLTALLIGRAYTASQALIISLIMITLYDPIHLLYDVSLHLSFLASAGIIYMSDGIKNSVSTVKLGLYKEIFITTLCAYLATLPYVIYTFGTISLYSLITNSIVLPFVPISMLVTFLIVIIAPVSSTLAHIFGYIETLIGNWIIFVARTVEAIPFSSTAVSISFTTMCVMYLLIIVLYRFFIEYYVRSLKNETSLTKDGEIFSEIISF